MVDRIPNSWFNSDPLSRRWGIRQTEKRRKGGVYSSCALSFLARNLLSENGTEDVPRGTSGLARRSIMIVRILEEEF